MGDFWSKKVREVYGQFNSHKSSFLRQSEVVRVMHNTDPNIVNPLIEQLKGNEKIPLVQDPSVGSPRIAWEGMSQSTMRSLHYYEEVSELFDVSTINHVTDFGPGYGNNCRVWHSLGFKGDFFLVDLPEMNEIQRHYLSQVLEDTSNLTFMQAGPDIVPQKSKALFFATFSLNETTQKVRDLVEPQILLHDYIFIHYNKSFPVEEKSIDNIDYFDRFKERHADKYEFVERTNPQRKHVLVGIKR